MAEKMSLRDRRRLETGREIRRAVLRLCLRDGYDAVTTEMISAEAGISPRTFFNYFPNKEAALVGPADEMDRAIVERFVRGEGSIPEDFLEILRAHFTEQPPEREFMEGMFKLRDSSPQLELIFARSMSRIVAQTSLALQQRLGPDSKALADLLSATLTQSVTTAMTHWAADESATVDDLLAEVERLLAALSQHLSALG